MVNLARSVRPGFAFAVIFAAVASEPAAGHGAFLRSHRAYDVDFQSAMVAVMGCGTRVEASAQEQLSSIKRLLQPLWDTLPKNKLGNVEWHMVRYAAHRFFMQQYNVWVNGLEPTKHVNESALGRTDMLSGKGESVLEAVIKGKLNGQGFSFDDITFLIDTLVQAVFDTDANRLEQAYHEAHVDPRSASGSRHVELVISAYLAIWTDDGDGAPRRSWQWRSFATWIAKKMEFDVSRSPRSGLGRAAMQQTFVFEDVHRAIVDITRSAAAYWEGDCRRMKSVLVGMDRTGIGRIPLADFYGKKADGDARFAESEAYLRDLGALDETSASFSKQVVIPNYLQGASNCIVTTPFYMVCCASECEEVLNDIQDSVGAPAASAEVIMGLVMSMENFDDEAPSLDKPLIRQLHKIADTHGGLVPLHGRVFALWLHYAFPRECPYPHKAGTASATPMNQFTGSVASDDDVRSYSAQRNSSQERIRDVERAHWMLQWLVEEEMDMGLDLGAAPWERACGWGSYVCGGVAMLGAAWALTEIAAKMTRAARQSPRMAEQKSSFV